MLFTIPDIGGLLGQAQQQAVLTQHLTLRDVQVGGRGFRLDNRGLCLPAHRHACVPSSWVHSYQSSFLVVATLVIAETPTAEKTVMKCSVSHATCRDRNGHDYHDHGGKDADDTEEEDADHDRRRHQSRSVSHMKGIQQSRSFTRDKHLTNIFTHPLSLCRQKTTDATTLPIGYVRITWILMG